VRQGTLFLRSYRAALLDFAKGGGEPALSRAYEHGRMAIDDGLGLLEILRIHQDVLNEIFESTPAADERLRLLHASEEFLMEALATFEMASRGYVAMLDPHHRKASGTLVRRESHR
jgi:hypothetical protein